MAFASDTISKPSRSFLSLSTFSLIGISLLSRVASAQKDNGANCSCFKTNGSTAGYFAYHRFMDFRNVNLSLTSRPSLLVDPTNTSNANATSTFFTSQAWTRDWSTQAWNNSDVSANNNGTVLMINSPNNVYIEKSTDDSQDYKTYLTLRTARTKTFQSAAEIDSAEQNFHYLSARFLARVIGSPGACAGLFTYLDSSPVQEADIEILTSGPRNVVQYTNQPSNSDSDNILADATVNGTIPGGRDWSSWNAYRLDWTPTQSSWYVNGQSAATIKFQVPRDPAGLIVNMWSDGGPWTGNMSLHDSAYLQIQYIEIVYNTTGAYGGGSGSQTATKPRVSEPTQVLGIGRRELGREGDYLRGPVARHDDFGVAGFLEKRSSKEPGCQVVCSVDEEVDVADVGTPVILYNNTGAATSFIVRGHWSGLIPGMAVGALVGMVLYL